ncbi:MAG: alpha-amylase family glycosyl hydrolase [Ignavibacteriales bacterium]|nr:alpha-amylase family glycosyl hydrolase [Ignavibacteriales bacterium]
MAVVLFLLTGICSLHAQTVTIKFRFQPQADYVRVNFPGTFNGWGPNALGIIYAGAVSQADSLEISTGMWVKTVGIPFGSYQYKIYQQLGSTASNYKWIPDPLNRIVIAPDQNSGLTVDSLMLFQVCAYPYTLETIGGSQILVVRSSQPSLSAGIFQPAGAPTPVINVWVDGAAIANASAGFDARTGILTLKPGTPIADGIHMFAVQASAGGITKRDSVAFETRGKKLQILSPSFATRKAIYVTAGIVLSATGSGLDTSLQKVDIIVNGVTKIAAVIQGNFADSTVLMEGKNVIRVVSPSGEDSITVTKIVDHAPIGRAGISFLSGSSLQLSAGASTDPDGETLKDITWLDDPLTPVGFGGKKGMTISIIKPSKPGEYYFSLVVKDSIGNVDTARCYFIIKQDGSYANPSIASNPEWAKRGRIYFMFPLAQKTNGTINDAADRLDIVKKMGFSIIWMMPVMKNASPINGGSGPGYNITDFYNVAPEYGTNQDFRNFIAKAHTLGLKVILDVTPNHTSRFHPWSTDAHAKKQMSPYWNWYEHTQIVHNTNGLGQSFDADGFNYYSGFSDQLLNYNWKDIDARSEMINVYKYWIREFGLDGYRFDVYWGPHRRYGEAFMGQPVREALKHIKPDILLLAEDDGTGGGTETIYADISSGGINGGVDMAYDFKLFFNQIRGFGFSTGAVDNLHADISNGGFYPGPNSLYMRFMESQDEDRIAYVYSANGYYDAATTFQRTMPMATTIFGVPGVPMIWNGQEIGWGYGINSLDVRRRGTINWNNQGAGLLQPHYQKLATIRGAFPAFGTQSFIRVASANGYAYAFSRPFENQNAIVVANFAPSDAAVALSLDGSGVAPNVYFADGVQDGTTYYMNDVYNDTSYAVTFSKGSLLFPTSIKPYGTAIYILADTLVKMKYPALTDVRESNRIQTNPLTYSMEQNYPNPFNPSTAIKFSLRSSGLTSLKAFDVLGREVSVVLSQYLPVGNHTVSWNADGLPSGAYFLTIRSGDFVQTKRALLLK